MKKNLRAIGLMSGTSADGIDAALIETDGTTIQHLGPSCFIPYSKALKKTILSFYGKRPGLHVKALSISLTENHAEAVFTLLDKAQITHESIDVIGFHGQTLFHIPPRGKNEWGETFQIGEGELLASLTKIPVIEQFRINDVAHGGQGAPLVPLYHQALVRDLTKPLLVVNIGGVANVTWVGEGENNLVAFDTGPGNALIDDWVYENKHLPWDEEGQIAAKGKVNESLLYKWLLHPFFAQRPPKSLDRMTFRDCLNDVKTLSFEDGVATLTCFTAVALRKGFDHLPFVPFLCLVGGGAHNSTLLKMIETRCGIRLKKTSELGWDGDALEAQAFGFLAVRSLKNLPISLPGTTGVPYPLIGGKLCYPYSQV
ncbi:MAG: anhydro-N-acetylmuramic acid kinase [Alphaproteobacteria bacterium]|nr:anhydro-N-acetylmuramic acid kinase [Alphaproteobacteria bacterium]